MNLFEICCEIGDVETQLMFGEIECDLCCSDSLMAALKSGHPADVLDDILSIIGWDVHAGKTPSIENVREVYNQLKIFATGYKVKELRTPIEHLREYLSQNDPNYENK